MEHLLDFSADPDDHHFLDFESDNRLYRNEKAVMTPEGVTDLWRLFALTSIIR